MRLVQVAVLLTVVGCATQTPVEGPQGEMGPIGPAGPMGAAGPQGPAGPAGDAGPQGEPGPAGLALVLVHQLDAGVECENGGAMLRDNDGGSATVCSGRTGDPGAQGLQGPQGVQGIPGKSLYLKDVDGGIVGNFVHGGVYIEPIRCALSFDYSSNRLVAQQVTVYFQYPNCQGKMWVDPGLLLPFWCMATAEYGYRTKQPITMSAVSSLSIGNATGPQQPDGGAGFRCASMSTSNVSLLEVEMMNLPTLQGPFNYDIQ